ncbi:hypothetical protein [Micromonospora sp. L31]|uniref:hypothetical protein n=1 Tax=Micromonospora sp. L31 TaxID=3452213 RepID=UPI003F8B7965
MNPAAEPDPGAVFAPLPRAAVEALTGTDDPAPHHVIHLPVAVTDLAGALRFAYALARSLTSIPQIDAAGATVSTEDSQHVRNWVFCDLIMPDRRRCLLPADHHGHCSPADHP